MQQMIRFNITINTVSDRSWVFKMHGIIYFLFIHCNQLKAAILNFHMLKMYQMTTCAFI